MDIPISLTTLNYWKVLGVKYAFISEAWLRGQGKPGSSKTKKSQMRMTQVEMVSSMYLLSTTSNEKDKLCSGS